MAIDLNRGIFDAVAGVTGFRGPLPHAPQERFIDAFFGGKRFCTNVWGRRGGKTALLGDGLLPYAALQKDKQIWVVSKTYSLAGKVGAYLVKSLRKVMVEGRDYKVTNPSGSVRIRTRWNTLIELKSADHPDSLIGEGNDLVVFDEAATVKKRIWQQYLEPTLMDRRGQAIFITTPRGHNWVYDMFERGQNDDWPLYWSSRAPSSANPYLHPDELERARKDTDPLIWKQEYLAEFVSFANQVYATFDYDRHVVDRPDLDDWTVSVAVDPGLANPTAILWIAHNPVSGEDIIFREHIASSMLFPDVLRLLNQHQPEGGYDCLICDVAGRARSQETGASFIGWMKSNGMKFKARRVGIVDGINQVRSRLLNVEGETRLFVTENCRKTIQAIEGYHYPERDGEQREEPEKDGVFDHPMDALRYYVAWRHGSKPARSWSA